MWFLSALIFIELLSVLLNRVRVKIRFIIILATALLAALYAPYKSGSYVPWNVDVALFLLPFFEIGRIAKPLIAKLKKTSVALKAVGFSILVTLIPLSALNGDVNIYRCLFGQNILLYYINGMIGIVGMVSLSLLLSGHVAKIIAYCGRNTLVPMCIHQPLIMVFTRVFAHISLPSVYLSRFVLAIVVIVTSFAIGTIITQYCPFLVGRKRSIKE